MTRDVRIANADASAVAAEASPNFSYFASPRTNADATLHVAADADKRTLTRPSKVAFSLQQLP